MNHQNPTYLKRRSGIYYFTRRIPSELQRQYKRNRIYVSLKTRSQRKAMAASERISHELEASWARVHAGNVLQKLIPDELKKSIKTELPILLDADDKRALLPKLSDAGEKTAVQEEEVLARLLEQHLVACGLALFLRLPYSIGTC
jgi:hypothetical protein